jgi:hypothetical protein
MNKTASLSIVATLALLVIPADAAFASEVNAKKSTLQKRVATKVLNSNPASYRTLNPQLLPPKDGGVSQKGIIIVGGKGQIGSDRMLNPQPLPPGKTIKTTGNFGSDRMLNPQPLPPKDAGLSQRGIIIVSGKNQIGSDRMLNPQPLPPKDKFATFKNYGSDRALNPQPLPPKETLKLMVR